MALTENDLKARKLRDELTALLVAEPGDAKALDSAVANGVPDALANAEPTLRPLVKLARARSLLLQGRVDEASNALGDVRALAERLGSREQRRISAEVRFRQAEIEEAKSEGSPSCASLGLKRLASLEGRNARQRMEQLANRYRAVVKVGDRFWSRRAAFRTARLYDEFYRRALAAPGGFRGTALPSPFAVSRVDTRALVGEVLGGAWPAEISRLYSEVMGSIDARDPDPILIEQVRQRAAAFARLELPPGERAENPWLAEEKAGIIRYNRRYEQKGEGRKWTALSPQEAKPLVERALSLPPGSAEHAYALAASAEVGTAPTTEQISAAIAHADPRVQLAGLFAAERQPSPALFEAVIGRAIAQPAGPAVAPFSTLQTSLFGVRERALLALRAIANKDRATAEKLLGDERLPVRERTWIVAELGEARLQQALQNLSRDRDPVVAATALYGLFLATGKRSLGYMRPTEAGEVGCVSRAMQSMDAPR